MGKPLRERKASKPGRAVENRQGKLRFSLPAMERFQQKLNRELGLPQGSAFVCFVTGAEMKRLNAQFRRKPKTTDVLSFPSAVRTRPKSLAVRVRQLGGEFLGDIAISPAVARRKTSAPGAGVVVEVPIKSFLWKLTKSIQKRSAIC